MGICTLEIFAEQTKKLKLVFQKCYEGDRPRRNLVQCRQRNQWQSLSPSVCWLEPVAVDISVSQVYLQLSLAALFVCIYSIISVTRETWPLNVSLRLHSVYTTHTAGNNKHHHRCPQTDCPGIINCPLCNIEIYIKNLFSCGKYFVT